jgi:hypothetical protein
MLAPVVVFVYCRLEHTQKTLQALNKNILAEETDLFIYADNAKKEDMIEKVNGVREYIDGFASNSNFRNVTVIKAEKNKGLANSIISGVSEVIDKYGKVIVVEDDLLTDKDFLVYMNGALDFYENDSSVGSISAYTYDIKALKNYDKDVYATYKGECWGWATWKNVWKNVDWSVSNYKSFYRDIKKRNKFDSLEIGLTHMLDMQMDGKIDSWAVRWVYYLFENNLITIYPKVSKVVNFGFDGSGTHCKIVRKVSEKFEDGCNSVKYEAVSVLPHIAKQVARYETRNPIIWLERIVARCLFRFGIKI